MTAFLWIGGALTALLFVYLVWALLHAEDF